ncbi:bifunctional diguanylate cyclase/phosphohydrolase [Brevibacillus sp. NRS-1366]|uniref:bifunctional diguanylate cyclase/phosphohydrolase n=1 Tax=Brevibacillus sp. NRS-1366 TaxID=3233899 RepID=UPI003D202AF4
MGLRKTNQVFSQELQTLDEARAKLSTAEYQESTFIPHFEELLKDYEHLLKTSIKTLNIGDLLAKELRRRESEIKTLLDNVDQGFLTFGQDLIVDKAYSAKTIEIIKKNPSKQKITDLLWSDDSKEKQEMERLLKQYFATQPRTEKEEIIKQLPTQITLNSESILLQFIPISPLEYKEVQEEIILLILTDITEKLQSQKRLEYLSYHDSLTTLHNRAYMDIFCEQLTNDMFPLGIVFIDMNGLKLINDVFGHETGDQFLQHAANVLKTAAPDHSNMFRWGGDEFIILIPNANEAICEQLKQTIKNHGENHSQSEANHIQLPFEISMSIGISIMEKNTDHITSYLKIAEKKMYREKFRESRVFQNRMIQKGIKMLEELQLISPGHLERTKEMATHFAIKLGYQPNDAKVQNLQLVAELHDLGKITFPKELIAKTGSLTEKEIELIQSHSETGFRIAKSTGYARVAEAILSLHEKWDGTGYPYGLMKTEIPFLSRLFLIVEAFDVMTHHRVYKQAVDTETALYEIKEQSGKKFDPYLVEKFIEFMRER